MGLNNTESNHYAEVIIDISIEKLDRPFTYRIPDRLSGIICAGSRVIIPFGNGNTPKKGYVISVKDTADYDPGRIKDIMDYVEGSVSAIERSFETASFIKDNYGGTLSQALKVVIPVKSKVRETQRKVLVRKLGREEIMALLAESSRKKQKGKEKLYSALLDNERIPGEWISHNLGVSMQTVLSVVKSGAAYIETTKEYRKPSVSEISKAPNNVLNEEQEAAVKAISHDMDEGIFSNYLIHGITGSGKTEVYIRLAEKTVLMGRQVIFLIPEIALTYQTLARFYSKFGDRVSVLNSRMSAGEKYDQCKRAENGDIDIIIGPRSALFTPFPDIGLIIMDEEHESSYKSENTPKFHAREVAKYIAGRSSAAFVMGSATPSLETYKDCMDGKIRLFKLTERAAGGELAETEIVDLREELRQRNRSMFSRRLKSLMDEALSSGEQVMIFLNRRGFSGQISCRECGKPIFCPHCSVPMSLHKGGKLVCHYCGEMMDKPSLCPGCGSKYLSAFKVGTQQVEDKVKEMYPDKKVLRMDKDTTSEKGAFERILAEFSSGDAQILIGTQMIVKGHDFPNVTVVGILAADMSLGEGDYRSSERTFSLLTQAAGRSGRGDRRGHAVIQTYQPEHYAITCAAEQNYEKFYEEEMVYRLSAGYPPALHMMGIMLFGLNEDATSKLAENVANVIKSNGACRVLGPAPAIISRIKDYYRFVIYIKNADADLLKDIRQKAEDYLLTCDLKNIYVQFDLDPIGQM